MLHQYLLSDSLVRRIIVPTTCCTRLVPRAGDLLLHRSFSSIYLKRQTDVASWKRRHEEEQAHAMLAANNQGRRASQSILRMSGAVCTRALKNTMTRSDRDLPPVIRGLFGHKDSRSRYCGGGLNVYFSGADAWLVCVRAAAHVARRCFPAAQWHILSAVHSVIGLFDLTRQNEGRNVLAAWRTMHPRCDQSSYQWWIPSWQLTISSYSFLLDWILRGHRALWLTLPLSGSDDRHPSLIAKRAV